MSEKYKSYQQGYSDTCSKLGDRIPSTMLCDDPLDEDSEQWDSMEYMRGQVNALIEHVKIHDKANRRTANTASCLANGIIPD